MGNGQPGNHRRVDAVARYRRALEQNDIVDLMDRLAPDAEPRSPLWGRMAFRGHEDLRVLLAAGYGSLTHAMCPKP